MSIAVSERATKKINIISIINRDVLQSCYMYNYTFSYVDIPYYFAAI